MIEKEEQKNFIYEKFPFKEAFPVYKMHRAYQKKDGPVSGFAYCYNLNNLKKHNFDSIFQFNKEVFTEAKELKKGKNLLKIKNYLRKGEEVFIVVQPFTESLKNFIETQKSTQQEAMKILIEILQSVYSVIVSRFTCLNIRPEHFVNVAGHWKLKSLVYSHEIKKGFASEYLWDSNYQPPEAYTQKTFTQDELDQMIVWNIGSIFVDLLAGRHVLDSYEVIEKFADSNFNFELLGIKEKLSMQSYDLLQRTLAFDPKDRIKINDLFSLPFFKQIIEKAQNQSNIQQIKELKSIEKNKAELEKNLTEALQLQIFQPLPSTIRSKLAQIAQSNPAIKLDKLDSSIINPQFSPTFTTQNPQDKKKLEDLVNKYELQCSIASFLMKLSFKIGEKLKNTIENHESYLTKPFMNIIAVALMSLVTINKVFQSLTYFQNIYEAKTQIWNLFAESGLFETLKLYVTEEYKKLETCYWQFLKKSQSLLNEVKFPRNFKEFMERDYRKTTFEEVKEIYRKILFDSLFSLNNDAEKNIREMNYIGYALLFNKLHVKEEEDENFLQFMRIHYRQRQVTFSIAKYEEFLNCSSANIINKHFRFLQRKYFK